MLSQQISIQCAELPDKTFPMKPESSVQPLSSSQIMAQPQADCDTIFFVGKESLTLTNLLMTNSSCEVHYHTHTLFHKPKSMSPLGTLLWSNNGDGTDRVYANEQTTHAEIRGCAEGPRCRRFRDSCRHTRCWWDLFPYKFSVGGLTRNQLPTFPLFLDYVPYYLERIKRVTQSASGSSIQPSSQTFLRLNASCWWPVLKIV